MKTKATILNLISLNGGIFQIDYIPKQTIGSLCENLTIKFPKSFPKDKDSWFFSLIQNGKALNGNNMVDLNASLLIIEEHGYILALPGINIKNVIQDVEEKV